VDEVVGVCCGRGRLPYHDVSDQRGSSRQVPPDRSEIEGRDGERESFERAVFDPVPGSRCIFGRLLCVELFDEFDTKTEEIAEL